MDRFIQSCILGLMYAGVFGLAQEYGQDITQPLFWMIFTVVGLLALVLLHNYRANWIDPRAPRSTMNQEDVKRFEHRMKRIMALADTAMKQAHPGDSTFPVRSSVVVEYDRLLMIWDLADLAKSETPV